MYNHLDVDMSVVISNIEPKPLVISKIPSFGEGGRNSYMS